MNAFDQQSVVSESPLSEEGYSLSLAARIREWFYGVFIQRKDFSEAVREFASFFEFELAAKAADQHYEEIALELNDEYDGFEKIYFDHDLQNEVLSGYTPLCRLLYKLGIDRLRFSVRLKQDQVVQTLMFLASNRRTIERARKGKRIGSMVHALMSRQTVNLACTRTRIDGSDFIVQYSYCTLKYSHLVHWFERRQAVFRDHRALFRVARRYAFFSVLFVLGGSLIYSVISREWYLFGIIVLAGVMLYAMVYLLFMVVGSIEYDNEEKSYRLNRAFGQMKQYTSMIEADIRRARDVQEILLPVISDIPFQDRINWAGWFMPTAAVGGDYYDVQRIDENRLALIFSDVCGHGLSASLITAVIKTTFQGCLDRGVNLEEIVEYLNLNLCRLTPEGSFAATFIAIYDTQSGVLTYCNAGHQPEPWIIPADAALPIRTLNDARFLLLGIEENYQACYSEYRLKPGDKFVIVSDGITESSDKRGGYFGNERLETLLESKRQSEPKLLLDQIFDAVQAFSHSKKCEDDCTMLAFEVKASAQSD